MPVGDSKSLATQWPANLLAYSSPNVQFLSTPTSLAVGGQTVAQLAASIDANIAAMTAKPDHILWNMGVNDAHPLNGYPPVEATWKADVLYCWDALHAKWPNAQIYMMHVWRQEYPANCGVLDGYYDDILPTRAFVTSIADERVWLENGDDGVTYSVDGTHYNVAGNQLAADLWRAAIGY